jgi:hypothetical protein
MKPGQYPHSSSKRPLPDLRVFGLPLLINAKLVAT